MSDKVIKMPIRDAQSRATSQDVIHCRDCDEAVEIPYGFLPYAQERCPRCGASWTGLEKRSTMVNVSMPESITGGAA